jgi:hypothetical protein
MAQSSVEITVPEDIAERIRAKVASGGLRLGKGGNRRGSAGARGAGGGHRALALRETAAPTYDRIKAGQKALIPIDEVFDGLLKRSEARKTQKTS